MREYIKTNIYIRDLIDRDIESLRLLRNREENRKNFIYQKEISYDNQIEWFRTYCQKNDDNMYSVVSEIDNTLIGFAAIYNIDDCKGEFGRLLLDKRKYKQSGLGKCIVMKVIDIAKQKLYLQKLILEVFSDNMPALTIYKQCGFIEYDRAIINNKEIIYMERYL